MRSGTRVRPRSLMRAASWAICLRWSRSLGGRGGSGALVAGVGVGGDLHVQDELVAVDHGVGVLERPLALAEGLDLAAPQDQAGLDRLEDLVVVAGTAVGRHRARGLAPGHPRDRR